MGEIAFITPHEQEISRQHDNQRRLRLARLIASVSSMLSGSVAFILTVYLLFHISSPDSFVLVLTVVCWLVTACDLLGLIAARHGSANLTALFICGSVLTAIAIVLADTLATTGLNAFSLILLSALPIVIVISGILGNSPLLIGISVLSVLGGCVVLVFNAQAPMLAQDNAFVIILVFAAILGTITVMMVIFQQGYQRTLRELGDIRIAYERASALDDLKNQFIVNVNHELRNPVMAMMGHLDILDMSLATAPRERLQKAAQGAIRASENLRKLLTSILDASRLEQGPGEFTPERVPLAQAIQAATQLLDPQEGNLSERELRVGVPKDLSIWGEPIRLQQILTNLLSNALKYSAPGTPIEVTARIIIEPGPPSTWRRRARPAAPHKLVEITVRDWGLGIPSEQIPLLFQRFVRLPRDLASTVVGNGLGLYVCRICAEAMGGRIWVESSGVEGEGSAFHLWLPLPPSTEGM
jgi:signal transduction histidine kinase